MSNKKDNGNSNKYQKASKVIRKNSLGGISAMRPVKPAQGDQKKPSAQSDGGKSKK